jgi:hypothetical protein
MFQVRPQPRRRQASGSPCAQRRAHRQRLADVLVPGGGPRASAERASAWISAAINDIQAARPRAVDAVVNLDDSGARDGNMVIGRTATGAAPGRLLVPSVSVGGVLESAEQDPVLEPCPLLFQARQRGAKPSDTLLLFSAALLDGIRLAHVARPGLAPPPAKPPELAFE